MCMGGIRTGNPSNYSWGNQSFLRFSLTAYTEGRTAVTLVPPSRQPLDHLLADEAILLARQFCDCLRDRVDDFICFRGIDFV